MPPLPKPPSLPRPTKLGIYVTKNPARLDPDWMNVSNTLDVYPVFPQQVLNVAVFGQNSNCEQERSMCIRPWPLPPHMENM